MTDILFSTPSFFSGVGRTIDIAAVLEFSSYNISDTPKEADDLAITNDFAVVGHDLGAAIERVVEELE